MVIYVSYRKMSRSNYKSWTHRQFLNFKVKDRNSKFSCALKVVYCNNNMEERKKIWQGITRIGAQIDIPWCVCGEFNFSLNSEDRVVGQPIVESDIIDFDKIVEELNMVDMKHTGKHFT